MSLGHGASIVTDNLEFYIDAANPRSYGGSGTTWYDLSKKARNATLEDGATISSGYVSLDSSTASFESGNDYVSATKDLNILDAPLTYNCWFNLASSGYDAASKTMALVGCSGTSPTGIGMQLGISGSTRKLWGLVYNSSGGQHQINATTLLNFDTWYMGSMIHDNTNTTLYLNGQQENQISVSGYTPWPSNTTQEFTVGLNRIYFHFGGLISLVQVYSSALTQAQLEQTFEAVRGRYGV